MKRWKLENWCFAAVEKIKYRPDRDTVYAELLQHMDDRCESFIAQGMTKEEAITKTVEVMGDPHELAVQLAAIHRPFWGFACSITKWLLRAVAIITAVVLLVNIVVHFLDKSPNFDKPDPLWRGNETVYLSAKQNWVDSSDGYTFVVKNAYIRGETYIYNDGTEETKLFLLVEMTILTFSNIVSPSGATDRFWGIDNQGRLYDGRYFRVFKATPERPFINDHVYKIPLETYEDLTWFELRYTDAGRDLVLHIDLTGGDSV